MILSPGTVPSGPVTVSLYCRGRTVYGDTKPVISNGAVGRSAATEAAQETHSRVRRERAREAKALLAPEGREGSRPNRADGSQKPVSYHLGRSLVGLRDRQPELPATRIADDQAAARSADAGVLEGADPHRHLQSLDLSALDGEQQTLLKSNLVIHAGVRRCVWGVGGKDSD